MICGDSSMKKIIVFGSRGFIGAYISNHLKECGYDVISTTGDIREKEEIKQYFSKGNIVLNCAGETKNIQDYNACFSTNVEGAKNIAELCKENDCTMIHLSSTTRYTAYGRSKQKSQELIETQLKKGLSGVILRLCPIVTWDDPLMVLGKRYPLEELAKDIEKIIREEKFTGEVVDYHNKTPQ